MVNSVNKSLKFQLPKSPLGRGGSFQAQRSSTRLKLPEGDGDGHQGASAVPSTAKVAFQRSVAKLLKANELAGLGKGLGGGALVLGPGLPRDVRKAANRSNALAGEPSTLTFHPPTTHASGHDRQAARRLLRLADPQSRMDFMRDHPFFKDTSMELRMRLAPQLVRRNVEGPPELFEQGAAPTGNMDYLFFVAPEITTKVEVLFDGQPIAVFAGNHVFGQEVVFGVTERFIFGTRVVTGRSSGAIVWVIPRAFIASLLEKEPFSEDVKTLQERSRETAVSILRTWYTQPMAQIRLRLFENAERAFKTSLVQAVTMEVHTHGSTLRNYDCAEDSCFCIFRGEAVVKVPGESEAVAKLSHGSGTSAWSAWWGLLEVLGVCSKSPAEVVAESDCVVWYLTPEALRSLRTHFPSECRLFDKVAQEHTKLLQPSAPSIVETPLFQGLSADLHLEVAAAMQTAVFGVGEVIISEGDTDDDLIFLARGRACVRRLQLERGQPGHPLPSAPPKAQAAARGPSGSGSARVNVDNMVAHLRGGSFLGEATALGYAAERTASVVAETVCDVRVLRGSKLLELTAAYPGLVPRLLELARKNGCCRLQCDVAGRPEAKDLALLRALNVSAEGLSTLDTAMGRLVTIRNQLFERQGSPAGMLYVFVEGTILVEVDEKVVTEIEAPALLGEQALLEPGKLQEAGLRSKGVCCFRTLSSERARQLLDCLPGDREKLWQAAWESWEDFLATATGQQVSRQDKFSVGKSEACRCPSPPVATVVSESADGAADVQDAEDGVNFVNGRPTVAFLARCFRDSAEGFLEYIVEGMHKIIYTDQEAIMIEGEKGDFAVCIYKGSGKVEIGGVKVGEVKAGSLVGEAAVFAEGAKRTATVRAVGLVSAYKLPRALLLEAFDAFPTERKHIEDLARLRGLTNRALTALEKPEEQHQETQSTLAPVASRVTRPMDHLHHVGFGRVGALPDVRTGSQAGPGISPRRAERAVADSNVTGAGGAGSGRRASRAFLPSSLFVRRGSVADHSLVVPEGSPLLEEISEWKPGDGGNRGTAASKSSTSSGSEATTRDWAKRRQAQIQEAQTKRNQRLARRGDMLPLVPTSHGYSVPEASQGGPGSAGASPSPSHCSLRRAKGIYSPPVWHEVFGT